MKVLCNHFTLHRCITKRKIFITLNQWFDESLLIDTVSQPIYYPSINKENLEQKKFYSV